MSFLDDWKEWSTAKKAISIIGVCCIGLILIAVITGGLSTDKNTSPATTSNTTTDNNSNAPAQEQAKGVQVHIISEGSWSGSIGDAGSQSTYDGDGEKTIDLPDAKSVVSAAIQKKSDDSSELKVEILKDGKVIKDGSTSGQYGVVTVSTTI